MIMARCRSHRRFQGTMVVHTDTKQAAPYVSTEIERLQRRKNSRTPKRRISSEGHSRRAKTARNTESTPTVYSTLVRTLFVLAHFRPGPSDDLFDHVAGWTHDGRVLSESDIVVLEDKFNIMDHRLDHLFHPWVREMRIYDNAYDYMDIPFIVEAVTHTGHDFVMKEASRSERQSVTHALALLHSHLNVPPPNRRTTI